MQNRGGSSDYRGGMSKPKRKPNSISTAYNLAKDVAVDIPLEIGEKAFEYGKGLAKANVSGAKDILGGGGGAVKGVAKMAVAPITSLAGMMAGRVKKQPKKLQAQPLMPRSAPSMPRTGRTSNKPGKSFLNKG